MATTTPGSAAAATQVIDSIANNVVHVKGWVAAIVEIPVVTLTKITAPYTVTKRIERDPAGNIQKRQAIPLSNGQAERVYINGEDGFARGFANVLKSLTHDQLLVYGLSQEPRCRVTAKEKLKEAGNLANTIARTNEFFNWSDGPGVLMLDYDPQEGKTPLSQDELLEAIRKCLPGLVDCAHVWWCSSSSYIYEGDKEISGLNGQRVYILVKSAADIERAGKVLATRLWLAGYGYVFIDEAGRPRPRTLVDESVWGVTRLDYASGMSCGKGFEQHRGEPAVYEGELLDTKNALPNLTPDEEKKLKALKTQALKDAEPEIEIKKAECKAKREQEMLACKSEATDEDRVRIKQIAIRAVENNLLVGDFVIQLVDGSKVTVGELLDSPDLYDKELTLDPLEPEYHGGKQVGQLFLKQPQPKLHSQAHGGQTFELYRKLTFGSDGSSTQTPLYDLDGMLRDLVLISGMNLIGSKISPSTPWKIDAARNLFAPCQTWVGNNAQGKDYPTFPLWLKHKDRNVVETITFRPGHDVICKDPLNRPALNSWRDFDYDESLVNTDITPFLNHVKYLFGDAAEVFLDWLAHTVQKPGVLPHFGWVHISQETGKGRSMLGGFLARGVFGGYGAPGVDLISLLNSNFNAPISKKLLAVVDEIKVDNNSKYNHKERLKTLVNTESRFINEKNVPQYQEYNACRWLIFSNHSDALALDDSDRRFWVFDHDEKTKTPEYYKALVSWFREDRNADAVRLWLRERDITEFNPGQRPPLNEAKQRVIESNKSELALCIEEFVVDWPGDVFSNADVKKFIPVSMFSFDNKQADKELAHIFRGLGCARISRQVRAGGDPERCWVLHNHTKWCDADTSKLRTELLRGRSLFKERQP